MLFLYISLNTEESQNFFFLLVQGFLTHPFSLWNAKCKPFHGIRGMQTRKQRFSFSSWNSRQDFRLISRNLRIVLVLYSGEEVIWETKSVRIVGFSRLERSYLPDVEGGGQWGKGAMAPCFEEYTSTLKTCYIAVWPMWDNMMIIKQ